MSLLPPSEAPRNLFTRLSYVDLALTQHPEAFLPNTSTTDPFSPAALLRIAAGRELTTIDDIQAIPTEVKLQLVPQLDIIGAAVWGNHVFQDMKRESAALQLPPNLGATPAEQVTYEEDLVNGAAFVYPFGQISWGIARVLAEAHRNTKGVFRYATMFSNPKFGDEAKNRQAVHKDGAVPRLGKTKFEGHEAMPVPYEHAQLYLRNSKTIVLAPVADGLPTLLTDENIIALLSNTNEQVDLFTAIKGLDPEGRTAMEVIKFRIEEMKARLQARDPERKFPKIKIIDVLGYYPVKVVQKALEEGDAPPDLRLVFACEDEPYAKELVAKYSSQNIQVRAVPAKAVKAVELASIYKNFLGIHLGKLLFEEAHKVLFNKSDTIYQQYSHLSGEQKPAALSEHLSRVYQQKVIEAQRAIMGQLALEIDGFNLSDIPPEVIEDMIGSWKVNDFENILKRVYGAFSKPTPENLQAIKLEIPNDFTVRNIEYGFGRRFQMQLEAEGHSFTLREKEAEVVFSILRSDLTAEGSGISRRFPDRMRKAGKKFRHVPIMLREAHAFIDHIQTAIFPDAVVSKEIINSLHGIGRNIHPSQEALSASVTRLTETMARLEEHWRLRKEASGATQDEGQKYAFLHSFNKKLRVLKDTLENTTLTQNQRTQLAQNILTVFSLTSRMLMIHVSGYTEMSRFFFSIVSDKFRIEPRDETEGDFSNNPDAAKILAPMLTATEKMTGRLFHPSETITGSTFNRILPDVIKALKRPPLSLLDQASALVDQLKGINELAQRPIQSSTTLTLTMQALMETLIASRQLLTDASKLEETVGEILLRLKQIHAYLYYHAASREKRNEENLEAIVYPFPV